MAWRKIIMDKSIIKLFLVTITARCLIDIEYNQENIPEAWSKEWLELIFEVLVVNKSEISCFLARVQI